MKREADSPVVSLSNDLRLSRCTSHRNAPELKLSGSSETSTRYSRMEENKVNVIALDKTHLNNSRIKPRGSRRVLAQPIKNKEQAFFYVHGTRSDSRLTSRGCCVKRVATRPLPRVARRAHTRHYPHHSTSFSISSTSKSPSLLRDLTRARGTFLNVYGTLSFLY